MWSATSVPGNQTRPPSYNSTMQTNTTPGYWPCRSQPVGSSQPIAGPTSMHYMHPQSRPFPLHITPASIVRPYLSAQPQHAFLQCGGFNTHPVQYTTPFVEPRTSSGQLSSVTLSTHQNTSLANTQIPQYPTCQQPVAERSTFALSAQNLPPPTDLFHTNSRPAVKMPTPESRGRKTIEDSVFHQNFVRKVLIEFFQVGQSSLHS